MFKETNTLWYKIAWQTCKIIDHKGKKPRNIPINRSLQSQLVLKELFFLENCFCLISFKNTQIKSVLNKLNVKALRKKYIFAAT